MVYASNILQTSNNKKNNRRHYIYSVMIGHCSKPLLFSLLTFTITAILGATSPIDTHASYYSVGMSTSGSVTVDINSTSANNGAAVASDNITVTSTCPYGYTVSISGPSDRNLYKDGNSSNNTSGTYIAPSSGTTSSPVSITGANQGTWGYSLSSTTTSGTFIGLPSSQTTLTSNNSASASGGDNIPVYYGVSVPSSLAPGEYKMTGTSSITYYLTTNENCFSYQVSYNANGGSGTAMSNQRIYEGVATELSANTYTAPSGQIFKEWNTAADGSGTSYTDQQSVTDIATPGTTLPLYAIWITPVYMQDITFSECTTTPMTVYDKRDMQAYAIAKLADGKCWMTSNLNLTGGTKLDSDNSDVPSGYTQSSPYYTLPTSTAISSGTSVPSDQFSSDTGEYVFNTGNNTTTCNSSTPCNSYYSWLVATAGGKDSNGTAVSTNGYNAAYSICPKGWRLPTSTTSNANATTSPNWKTGDWYALATAYGANLESNYYESAATFYNNAGPGTTPNFLLAGYYYNGSFSNGGSRGIYWSSTAFSSTSAYLLSFNSGNVYLASLNSRRYGYSVRCVKEPKYLYDEVAAMSKGTQTLAQLRAAITVPTSADRTQDTSNSGVYEYNSSVFGTDSDATKSNGTKATIYYYRGVLENSVGSYGSDGSATTYPNYVILDADGSKTTADTCWRIVRTTGSGGVKMIYNGKWTGSTCANSTTKAQVTTKAFDTTANSSGKSIVGVGYTYNASYKSTTSSTAYSTLFGSNTSYSGNSATSTMKTYIENTWFTNINSYSSILEPSAGYCNDRTIRSSSSSTSVIGDSTSISTPYTTASSGITQYYFGAYVRNITTSDKPTLGCPRSNADLYTTSSASNGNKQLAKPAALITADEAAFAGSGYSSSTTPYHANSYLRSGSSFWLLSPRVRSSSGYAVGFFLGSNGGLNSNYVYNASGVRPAISLTSGTTIASGSGTATDPWVVTAP